MTPRPLDGAPGHASLDHPLCGLCAPSAASRRSAKPSRLDFAPGGLRASPASASRAARAERVASSRGAFTTLVFWLTAPMRKQRPFLCSLAMAQLDPLQPLRIGRRASAKREKADFGRRRRVALSSAAADRVFDPEQATG